MNLDKKDNTEEKTIIVQPVYRQLLIFLLVIIAGVLGYNGMQGWGCFLFVAVILM